MHNVPLVHKVVIVNERAEVKGHLRVAIEPVLDGMFYRSLRVEIIANKGYIFIKSSQQICYDIIQMR